MVGTLPSHRLADDVPLLATPRHPTKSKLTVCNRLVYFKCTNFGGRSKKAGYIVLISNYVIARHRLRYKYSNDNGFLIVHARVPIPRKGSARLQLFVVTSELQITDI